MATYVDTGVAPSKGDLKASRNGKMSKEEVQNAVGKMLQDAMQWHHSSFAQKRIDATKYYQGEKFGDELAGRSKVVITTVRDAVLQIIPGLMDVFFGPDGAVEFVARREDAAGLAEQMTDYINYIFTEDNDGFLETHSVLKDGAVRRIGVFKWWWEEKMEVVTERFSGLTPDQLSALQSQYPDAEVEERQDNPDGTISCVLRVEVDRGKARVAAVPPRELVYNRGARSFDDACLVAHVTRKSAGDLLALGYKQEDIDKAGPGKILVNLQEEAESTREGESTTMIDESVRPENQLIDYTEAYVRLNFNGKGLELRKVCLIGLHVAAKPEPVSEIPFAFFTPDPEPHEIQGLSVADMTMDLQRINSHLARGALDSLSLSLTPGTVVDENRVNIRDVLNVDLNRVIRATGDVNAVRELTHKFVGADALNVMDYFKGIQEERLGSTRAAAGLNPDALQSSTQQAVSNTVNKEQARHRLMARIFAETTLKRVMKGLYNLVRRHQDAPRVVRLRGSYIAIDPRQWPEHPDVRVRVGIGAGTREERLAFLAAQAAEQKAQLQLFGPGTSNPLTDLSLYRQTLAEMVKLAGYDPSRFYKEVTPEALQQLEQQAAQQAQQGAQDPAAMVAMTQVQNEQLRLQLDMQKAHADAQYKLQQLELQRETMRLADERERAKLAADIELRVKDMEFKYAVQIDEAAIHAAADQEREITKAGANIISSAMSATGSEQAPVSPMPEEGDLMTGGEDIV
jgi:hypothetical protein